jgi:hypothetical protein
VIARDTRIAYLETHVIDVPGWRRAARRSGRGITASGVGFKYYCGSKFPLWMELSRHTWRLSICKETHVKSMDGTTTKQIIQNVSTLIFDHYYGHDNNIDASVNMLDYQGWESLVN